MHELLLHLQMYLQRRGSFAMAHKKSLVSWRKQLEDLAPKNKEETDLRQEYLKLIAEQTESRKA